MPLKDKKLIVYALRVLGFVLLITGLFLSLNLGKTWISWSHDRSLYHEVTATREDLTVVYKYQDKEYIVDTITGDSYKQIDLNEIFQNQKEITLYCANDDNSECLYLDYNYTNPIKTIFVSLIIAILGGFLAFPNRFINGFLYAKETIKSGKAKVTKQKAR